MSARYVRLVEGETVRDKDTGRRYRVSRVGLCSAELVGLSQGEGRLVVVPVKAKGRLVFDEAGEVVTRSFVAKETGEARLVSIHADVIHEGFEETSR